MIESFQVPAFADFAQVRHGFFTRKGGVSEGAYASLNCGIDSHDDMGCVAENIVRVASSLGVNPEKLVTCKQIHSDACLVVSHPWEPAGRPEADAMVTVRRGIALAIFTADCAPLFFVEPELGAIGAAHAGWRGAVSGVIENTIAKMEGLGARREKIHAAIGPCIGPASYEVDPGFPVPFLEEDEGFIRFFKESPRRGHFMFDLPAYIFAKLDRMGLASVSPSPADTCADEALFFSHRRGILRGQHEEGRMLSCIALVG